MKKLISVFVAMAIAAGAYAQIDSTNSKTVPPDMQSNQNQNSSIDNLVPDGVIMQNGIVMKVQDGQMTMLDDDMTMRNGTKITSDGFYTEKGGEEMMLKEGEHIDMSGTLVSMKTNNTDKDLDKNKDFDKNKDLDKDKDFDKNKDLDKDMEMDMEMDMDMDHNDNSDLNRDDRSNPGEKSLTDGVMMKDGKIMMVKDGEMTILDHDMTMSNGTKIKSDGSYVKKDGTKMTLKEGQHIDMSGNVKYIKTNKDKDMYLVSDSTSKKDC